MADDVDKYNNYSDPPKLPIESPVINRQEFFARDPDVPLPVYWGPKQSLHPDGSLNYPGTWPSATEILKLPIVIRICYDDPTICAEYDMWDGYSGLYSYGQHHLYFDLDIIDAITPADQSHTHYTSLAFFGATSYAIEGSQIYNGGNYPFSGNGGVNYWVTPTKLNTNGPFCWGDYVTPGPINGRSSLFEAFRIAAQILIDGYRDPFDRANSDGVPGALGIMTHSFGYESVGVGPPINLHKFTVDDIEYGAGIGFPYPLTINAGYRPPESVPLQTHGDAMQTIAQNLKDFFSPSQEDMFPWTDIIQIDLEDTNALKDMAPNVPQFFGTDTMHIFIFSSVQNDLSSDLHAKLLKYYKYFAGYRVFIFYDDGFLTDNGLAADEKAIIVNPLISMCNSLKDFGWVFGGSISYRDPSGSVEKIKLAVKDWYSTRPYTETKTRPMIPTVIKTDETVYLTVGNDAPADGAIIAEQA